MATVNPAIFKRDLIEELEKEAKNITATKNDDY